MIKNANDQNIEEAAALIKAGHVIAFPTETVYGLGADATNPKAVSQIYTIKNRPSFNPLLVHASDLAMAKKIAVFDERAALLASTFWPGPLTFVLPRRKDKDALLLPDLTVAGLETVAIRIPSNRVAQQLIKQTGVPIAAPSANISGQTSATTPQHIAEGLGDKVPFILAGGHCDIGLESTILDLSTDNATILRPGAVTIDDLAPLIGTIHFNGKNEDANIKSPGQVKRHYATRTPLRLNAVDVKKGEALLAFGKTHFMAHAEYGSAKDMPETLIKNLSPDGDLHEAANHLFSYMHDLDKLGAESIAVMNIPDTNIGIAINDRLRRAAIRD